MNRRIFLKSSAMAMFGVGTTPLWLSRALYAADAPSPRKKILVAIFQRGAVDGLNVVVPHGEQRYYDLRPSIAIPRPDNTADSAIDLDGFFGLAPVAQPAQADLRLGPHGDYPRGRVARSDAVAFRCAGLYGVGHAGPQSDLGWLAESGALSQRRPIVTRKSRPFARSAWAPICRARCAATTTRWPSTT